VQRALRSRDFDRNIVQCLQATWLRSQNAACKRARARTALNHVKPGRRSQLFPAIVKITSNDCSKQRANFWAGNEITAAPTGLAGCGVETCIAVQRKLHKLIEWDCPTSRDYRGRNLISRRRHW
jgi:hypothetical protein